jgi:hypothetical protein
MPNWCNNILTVSGTASSVNKFVKEVQRDVTYPGEKKVHLPFSFEKICPTPEALKNDEWQNNAIIAEANTKKYGYKGWYDFHCDEWGTKWELSSDTTVRKDKGKVTYSFQTAWSPPVPLITKASKLYPDLKFELRFCEEGMEFDGVFTARRGRSVK